MTSTDSRRLALWFGFGGGAVAWLLHFLAAYALGEFGCVGGAGRWQWLGVSAPAWAVLMITVAAATVSAAAAAMAFRLDHALAAEGQEEEGYERGLARIGWIASAIFTVVILFQAVPTLYLGGGC